MLKTLVLAAGRGTRLKSNTTKVLHKVFDKPILSWVLDGLADLDQEEIVVVCGHHSEEVKDFLHAYPVTTVDQEIQMGTGHAVMCAAHLFEEFEGTVMVVNGDSPLIRSETLSEMYSYHKQAESNMTLLTSFLDKPGGYGRIVRRNNSIIGIKEHKDCSEAEKTIREVNVGVYCFEWQLLKEGLSKLKSNNAQEEFYLTDLVEWAYCQGLNINNYILNDPREALGVNNRKDLALVYKLKNKHSLEQLMDNGVTIIDPDSTWISPDADIGPDTVIYPGTFIQRRVSIGSNCVIGPNAVIHGPVEIGSNSSVVQSHISRSSIGDHCNIGPYAHIRDGSDIRTGVRVGCYVEVKNSNLGDGTAAAHLSYLGDADIKSNVNVGAGTITANFNSFTGEKSETVICSGASTGANSVLIAPITVNESASVAAGSVVTKDVPENMLGIARPRQEIKRLPGAKV
ncbi:MAG: bifunctional UDP-N-acetylglucosamine diphosphorylase/glucosamine-1-phosphate N-acetyltransferase GlmU [Candidatus Caenarcaniphilales bacterium]|nr:bifunctional UDP-N-acetylglucosamine diphosphorylase/glucosamine-1-phosphate N-acetyltransferase GlmU [Candidatus Caenarcaniphilales bacterium]